METLEELKRQLLMKAAERKKYQGLDGLGYNGITIVALLATTAVTVIPADHPSQIVLLKALIGLATFLIAVDRTLNLGPRWRYHREMRHSYQSILTRISLYDAMADGKEAEERKRYLQQIYADLDALARREGQIPGIGRVPAAVSGTSN